GSLADRSRTDHPARRSGIHGAGEDSERPDSGTVVRFRRGKATAENAEYAEIVYMYKRTLRSLRSLRLLSASCLATVSSRRRKGTCSALCGGARAPVPISQIRRRA